MINLMIFSDALHPSHAKTRFPFLVLAVVWYGLLAALFQFGHIPGVKSSTTTFTIGAISTSLNVVAFCVRQLLELLLFNFKNLYTAKMYPCCYVLIRANLAIEELTEEQAGARTSQTIGLLSSTTSFKVKKGVRKTLSVVSDKTFNVKKEVKRTLSGVMSSINKPPPLGAATHADEL
jgi:hypothetical protein